LSQMKKIQAMTSRELEREQYKYNSVFINESSVECALLSAGSTVELVKKVLSGELDKGLAVVRPPGHHAVEHKAMGFCLLNNVAMAAKIALSAGLNRVLIVDWDVHHGNGTYEMFKTDPRVLFFSTHRYDKGSFYPCLPGASPQDVGEAEGQGYSVNVGWNESMVGDEPYKWAWEYVLLPMAKAFDPELILISAGFDAARGDPLGGCDITPSGYAHMLSSLLPFANGKIVVVLEGGYNLSSISASYAACAAVLLGDKFNQPEEPSRLKPQRALWVANSCKESICATIEAHQQYWPTLPQASDVRDNLTEELLAWQLKEGLKLDKK